MLEYNNRKIEDSNSDLTQILTIKSDISTERYLILQDSVANNLNELIDSFIKLSINNEYINKFIENKKRKRFKFLNSIFLEKSISLKKYFELSSNYSINQNTLSKIKGLFDQILNNLKELQDKNSLTFDIKKNSYNSFTEIKNILVSKCVKELTEKERSKILNYLIPQDTIKQLLNYKVIPANFINLDRAIKLISFQEVFTATNKFNLFYWEFDEKRADQNTNRVNEYKESIQLLFNYLIQNREEIKPILELENKEFELILQSLQLTDLFNYETNSKIRCFNKYLASHNLLEEIKELDKLAGYLNHKE